MQPQRRTRSQTARETAMFSSRTPEVAEMVGERVALATALPGISQPDQPADRSSSRAQAPVVAAQPCYDSAGPPPPQLHAPDNGSVPVAPRYDFAAASSPVRHPDADRGVLDPIARNPRLALAPPVRQAARRATARISAALASGGTAHHPDPPSSSPRAASSGAVVTRRRPRRAAPTSSASSASGRKRKAESPAGKLTIRKKAGLKKGDEDTLEVVGENGKKPSCCICIEEPSPSDLASVNGCKHFFCFECIEKWADRENTCPLCKERFSKIDRVNKSPGRSKKKRGVKNTKRVKNRDQRADMTNGNALQGLFATMEASGALHPSIAQLIFSGMTSLTVNRMPRGSGEDNNNSRASTSARSAQNNHARQGFAVMFGTDGPPSGTHPMPPMQFGDIRRLAGQGGADSLLEDWAIGGRSPLLRFGRGPLPPAPNAATASNAASSFGGGDQNEQANEESNGAPNAVGGYARFAQRVREMSQERNSVLQRFNYSTSAREGGVGAPSIHGVTLGGLPPLQRPGASAVSPPHQPRSSMRSYAVNSDDIDAGESPDNALEIEDSDDDDVVEVVPVS